MNPNLEVHEEEAVEEEVEEVTVTDSVIHNGDDIFEDTPEAKQDEEGQIVFACSRFSCKVLGDFAEVFRCSYPLCNRMMHVE